LDCITKVTRDIMQQDTFQEITTDCLPLDGEKSHREQRSIPGETVVALFVNGRHAATTLLSPGSLEEYTTGYLFAEEIIRRPEDIESIRIEENRISVLTKNPFRITGRRRTILAGCGGSTSYIDTASLPSIESDYRVSSSLLTSLSSQTCSPEHGIETAVLAGNDGIIAWYADIDCTSAVDRAIGSALLKQTDFSRTCLVISGLVTSEMVRRCLLAGIPVIGSIRAATTLAVRIAAEQHLSVAGFLTDDNLCLFTHPERIRGSG